MRNNAGLQDTQLNYSYQITPAITTVAMPLLLFGRGKKTGGAEQSIQEKQQKPQPKPKATAVGKYEVSENLLKFFVEKGLFKKSWVAIKEIPINDISAVESLGNSVTVTWKDGSGVFALKAKGGSFGGLREQIQGLLDEQRRTLEANAKVELRKSEVTKLIDASLGVVDVSFDLLMGLQVKPVNWTRLETYAGGLGKNLDLMEQTMAPLNVDFSKVSEAVKSQVPQKTSKETFCVLKSVYMYFDELDFEDDLTDVHPNFKDAKTVILAYYTLNDFVLGKLVGDKDDEKEGLALEAALQDLARATSFKVNFEDLKSRFDRVGFEGEVEDVVEGAREIFRAQMRNLDRPAEPPSSAEFPAEQAIVTPEPTPLPTPQEPEVPPSTPQSTIEPPTIEPAANQPPDIQPPIEPPMTEQTAPASPSKLTELEPLPTSNEPQQPINPTEPKIESATEPITEPPQQEATAPPAENAQAPVVEQQAMPQTEPAKPENEQTKTPVEPSPKRKGLGRRLRKSILGY